MAIRFTKGDTMTSTKRVTKASIGSTSNTMKGMPGHIKAGQDASDGGLTQKGGIGPKREGPIGSKGGGSAKSHFTAAKSRGSADKSYRATSTGPAGKISQGKMESMRGRAKFSSER